MAKRTPNEPSRVNVTIIAEGTRIDGTLDSTGDIRINGSIDGEIEVSGKVVIAENGRISGRISAESAVIAGKVTGDIVIAHKLSLAETARVEGSILADRLVVEEGAEFEGDCVTPRRPQPASATSDSESGPVAVATAQRAAA